MVKKIMKFFAYLLFFLFALAFFTPKESLYYLLEANLKKFEVVISNEKVMPHLLSLELTNLEVSAKGIDSAVVKEVDIILLLLYNKIELQDIQLSSVVEAYLPSKIKDVVVSYSIFNPLVITFDAEGGFGEAKGEVSIVERALNVKLKPSKIMLKRYKRTVRMLKKSENGEYVYAKVFK